MASLFRSCVFSQRELGFSFVPGPIIAVTNYRRVAESWAFVSGPADGLCVDMVMATRAYH
jgi:hypothetical protein